MERKSNNLEGLGSGTGDDAVVTRWSEWTSLV